MLKHNTNIFKTRKTICSVPYVKFQPNMSTVTKALNVKGMMGQWDLDHVWQNDKFIQTYFIIQVPFDSLLLFLHPFSLNTFDISHTTTWKLHLLHVCLKILHSYCTILKILLTWYTVLFWDTLYISFYDNIWIFHYRSQSTNLKQRTWKLDCIIITTECEWYCSLD